MYHQAIDLSSSAFDHNISSFDLSFGGDDDRSSSIVELSPDRASGAAAAGSLFRQAPKTRMATKTIATGDCNRTIVVAMVVVVVVML